MRHRHSTQFASFISLLLAFLIAFNFPLSRAVYAAGTQGANADASTGDQGDGASSPKAASGATQKAFQTNLFTGSTSYSIPIDVPSGKDGMQPQLGLTYSSEGGRSWVGYGWALGVGEIIRKGANGSVAQFNDTDEYAIQMQGVSGDLKQKAPGSNEYVTTDEQFFKIVKEPSNNRWTVFSPDGTEFHFGYPTTTSGVTTNAQIFRIGKTASDFNNVRTWAISEIKNRNGYSIDFVYTDATTNPGQSTNGDFYLNRIEYTKGNGINTGRIVDFAIADRCPSGTANNCNSVIESYATGSKVVLTKKLAYIRAWTNTARTKMYRAYAPKYTTLSISPGQDDWLMAETKMTRFESYQKWESGVDTTFNPLANPPDLRLAKVFQRWVLQYSPRPREWGSPITSDPILTTYTFVQERDLNGFGPYYVTKGARVTMANKDGLPEIVRSEGLRQSASSSTLDSSMQTNLGNGRWSGASGPPVPFVTNPNGLRANAWDYPWEDPGAQNIDINGDGFPDIAILVSAPGCTESPPKQIWLNDGHGNFAPNPAWEGGLPSWAYTVVNVCSQVDPISLGQPPRGAVVLQKNNGVLFMDLNGDRFPDLLVNNGTTQQVALNPGVGGATWPVSTGLSLIPSQFRTDFESFRSTDLNGDGLEDLVDSLSIPGGTSNCKIDPSDAAETPNNGANKDTFTYVSLNTGSGWTTPTLNGLACGIAKTGTAFAIQGTGGDRTKDISLGAQFGDVNGDRFPDLITNCWVKVNHENKGFADVCPIFTKTPTGADICTTDPTSFACQINQTWFLRATIEGRLGWFPRDPARYCRDSTGVIIQEEATCTPTDLTRFVRVQPAGQPETLTNYNYGTFAVDIRGEGRGPAYVQSVLNHASDGVVPPSVKEMYLPNGSEPAGLLSLVKPPTGGTLSFTYAPSTKFTNNDPTSQISFVKPVVEAITMDDGAGSTYTTRYFYEGGLYDNDKGEFLGFRRVTVTDPTALQQITTFHQGDALKGKVDSVESLGADNRRYSYAKYYYTTDSSEAPTCPSGDTDLFNFDCTVPYFNPVRRTVSYSFPTGSDAVYQQSVADQDYCTGSAGTSCGVVLRTDVGELVTKQKSIAKGDPRVTPASEWKVSMTRMVPNISDWIVSLPALQRVYQAVPANEDTDYVSQTKIIYEGSAVWDSPPTSSRVVRTETDGRLNGYSDSTSSEATYHPTFHQPTLTRDALGNPTTIEYGDGTNISTTNPIYPMRVTNAANQQVTTKYDAFGRVTTVTDSNNVMSESKYDEQHRPIRSKTYVAGTACSVSYPCNESKVEYFGFCDSACPSTQAADGWHTVDQPLAQHVRTSARQIAGQAENVTPGVGETNWPWSDQYMDALGRQWMSKAKILNADNSGTTTVVHETIFDSAGRAWKGSPPYIDGSRPDPNGNLWTTTTYDDAGRVFTISAPATDGATASVATVTTRYDIDSSTLGLLQTVIDPLGIEKDQITNAFGQLIFVTEYAKQYNSTAVVGHSVGYLYDALGGLSYMHDYPTSADSLLPIVTIEMKNDGLGRKRQMKDPDMGTWNYGYDRNGNLIDQYDALDVHTHLIYDSLNRVMEKDEESAPNALGQRTALERSLFTFDRLGGALKGASLGKLVDEARQRWVSGAWAQHYSSQFSYDTMGRLDWRDISIDGDTTPIRFQNVYNDANATTRIIYNATGSTSGPNPTKETVSYTYDSGTGQLTQMTSDQGGTYVNKVTYDEAGRMTSLVQGANRVFTQYGYNRDGNQRLNHLQVGPSLANPNSILDISYPAYDLSGNLQGIIERRYNVPMGDAEGTCLYNLTDDKTYEYDELERLTSANEIHYFNKLSSSKCTAGTTSNFESRFYGYDRMGNVMKVSWPAGSLSYQPFGQPYGVAPTPTPTPVPPSGGGKKGPPLIQ